MIYKYFSMVALPAFLMALALPVDAEESTAEGGAGEAAGAEAAKANPELENEIKFVEALINNAYPDIAAPVIEATKKKWPESEIRFFALEIRGMLALGQFDAAEKKIATLPDRKSLKYWAARLEVAVSYFGRGKKDECMQIYNDFFAAFPKPPKEIHDFYMNQCYAYGQLLAADKKWAKAAERYEVLLGQIKDEDWCNLACETVDLYLKLIDAGQKDPKAKGQTQSYIKAADKIVNKLLWQIERPLYFGRAVSMKAHIAQMQGDVDKASAFIDEYMPQLKEMHEQIVAADPEGKFGLLKQDPYPECLYLQAKILWEGAKAEYKQSKRDDEKIKAYLFGPKKDGRRQVEKGAFAKAQGIFLNFESSSWAPQAGDMAEEIKKFAEEKYKAKVKTRVTPEQIAKVRAAQFKDANEKFAAGTYLEAIDAYNIVLAKFPEMIESIAAIENVASSYIDLTIESEDEKLKEEYRDNADAIEAYLAERFAGAKDKKIMIAAGDATVRLAAKEVQFKQPARADQLFTDFCENYRQHPMAATLAAGKAMEFQKAQRYDDAIKFWKLIESNYSNTTHYATSLAQLSFCYGKTGDPKLEISYINKYLPIETLKIRRLQAQFQVAQMYQKDGLRILASAETNSTPEGVEADERRGTAQIVRAIKNFNGFVKEADSALNDPGTIKGDLEKYQQLKEAALFMIGECWGRMNRPEKNLKMYRERSAAAYEAYVKEYPEGKYAKIGYVKLGTIYTALGDLTKSKDALDRLSSKFPDSDEAKNAKPRLAKNLIEMGMKKEGAEIYAEMLKTTDGAYTAQQFLNAGEALIEGKSWDLANQAFEKCIHLAGTNHVTTMAKARLGIAKTSWKQGSLPEAREALDLFLQDPKMSKMAIAAEANFMLVEVASDQGKVEKDATMRGKYFGAAIGALKKVRQYWAKKPQWEQDQLDLLSGDVLVNRMKAEEAMNLKEEAKETCGRAASTFQVFLQAHGVTNEHPLDKMQPGEVANLERAYSTMVPLFSKLGADQADRVLKFGQEYMDLFPNGRARTTIANCMNQAKADLPAPGTVKNEEGKAKSEEVKKAASAEKTAETENK